jgi:hypothetical protein
MPPSSTGQESKDSALNMEVTQSPKMSVPIYQSARRLFPEKCKLHNDGLSIPDFTNVFYLREYIL